LPYISFKKVGVPLVGDFLVYECPTGWYTGGMTKETDVEIIIEQGTENQEVLEGTLTPIGNGDYIFKTTTER
jgi:hypothetical protein